MPPGPVFRPREGRDAGDRDELVGGALDTLGTAVVGEDATAGCGAAIAGGIAVSVCDAVAD